MRLPTSQLLACVAVLFADVLGGTHVWQRRWKLMELAILGLLSYVLDTYDRSGLASTRRATGDACTEPRRVHLAEVYGHVQVVVYKAAVLLRV